MEVTLFKINLDGAQLSANAPFSLGSDDTEEFDDDDGPQIREVGEEYNDDETESGKGKAAGAALIGLGFLFVVALLARKVRGGSDDE